MTNPVKTVQQGIEDVRRALLRTEQSPIGPRPAIYPTRLAGSLESEIGSFLDEVRKLSGVPQKVSPETIPAALQTLLAENNIHKATAWHSDFFEQIGLENTLRNMGVDLVSPNADKNEMALCDLGITEADYLLPETGTLVLRSSSEKPRAVSLLPRIHLAIVRPEMLRADLHQVFAEASDSHYLVFITGPSRTADIELTTTLGVHGPKNLFVWMMM